VFANVVLADEVNRAPPKTQAALLEAMEERQVSVDGTTHPLPEPFLVVATQNPIEQEGTFRLPEAERDRFIVKLSLGYPDVEGEMELLERRSNRRTITPSVDAVTDADTVRLLQGTPEDVSVEERVRRYVVALARATREDQRTEVGVSPRGVQRFFEAARARAAIAGRKYVAPDDVKAIARPVMAHRLVLTTQASVEGVEPASVVDDALQRVQVPAVAAEDEPPSASGDEAGEEGEAAGEANVGDAAVDDAAVDDAAAGDAAADDAAVDDAAAGDAAEEPVGEPAAGQEAAETVPPEPSAGTTAETPPGERVADESEGEDD
jgi:MoxR-like ATPase